MIDELAADGRLRPAPALRRLGHRQLDPVRQRRDLFQQHLRLGTEVDLAATRDHGHRHLLGTELEQQLHIALEAVENPPHGLLLVLAERRHGAGAASLSPR